MPKLVPVSERADGGVYVGALTVRDYFAAQALTGTMNHWERMMTDDEAGRLARWCYRWADAMIQERKK